jgi:transitional endoplasmic reticulum ATPase
MPLAADVDLDELARAAEDLTGADIEAVCKKAALVAIGDAQHGARGGPFTIRRSDFEAVLGNDGRGAPCIST